MKLIYIYFILITDVKDNIEVSNKHNGEAFVRIESKKKKKEKKERKKEKARVKKRKDGKTIEKMKPREIRVYCNLRGRVKLAD